MTRPNPARAGLVQRALWLAAKPEAGEAGVGADVELLAQDVVASHLIMADRVFFPLFSSAGAKAQ